MVFWFLVFIVLINCFTFCLLDFSKWQIGMYNFAFLFFCFFFNGSCSTTWWMWISYSRCCVTHVNVFLVHIWHYLTFLYFFFFDSCFVLFCLVWCIPSSSVFFLFFLHWFYSRLVMICIDFLFQDFWFFLWGWLKLVVEYRKLLYIMVYLLLIKSNDAMRWYLSSAVVGCAHQ